MYIYVVTYNIYSLLVIIIAYHIAYRFYP